LERLPDSRVIRRRTFALHFELEFDSLFETRS
jgi:hypothetical protein